MADREKIESSINGLVQEIKEGDVYKRYEKALAKVREFKGLQEDIDRFRGEWFRIQSEGAPDLFDKIDMVERDYATLRENPYVQEFLAAELALCRMYQEVNYRVLDALDFESAFLMNV